MIFLRLRRAPGRDKTSELSGKIVPPTKLGELVSSVVKVSPVLLVGREPPEVVVSKFKDYSQRITPIWITPVETRTPNAINPRDLYKLEAVILRDVSRRRSHVVLDGVEYLIIENGLVPTLKFIGKVRDITSLHGSDLYVVASEALDRRELALMRRVLGLP